MTNKNDSLEYISLNTKTQYDRFCLLKSYEKKFDILLQNEKVLKNAKLNNYVLSGFEKKIINRNLSLSSGQVHSL